MLYDGCNGQKIIDKFTKKQQTQSKIEKRKSTYKTLNENTKEITDSEFKIMSRQMIISLQRNHKSASLPISKKEDQAD